MRLFGHPVHVMFVHFPIALWPAHWMLHAFAGLLPTGTPDVAFWLLIAATAFGWCAALTGAADLIELFRGSDSRAQRAVICHAVINGSALAAFTTLALLEYASSPSISNGRGMLAAEAAAIVAVFVGNYFGGNVVWGGVAQSGLHAPRGS